MAETKIVRGFKTTDGIVKYDYNSLHNLPAVAKLIFCTRDTLPAPVEELVGNIALMEDEQTNSDIPLICYARGTNRYAWVSFWGEVILSASQLSTPVIEVVEDA